MRKSVNGFTIVELLIVIVVIAVLAAISVVAYTGIQQRANNTVRIAAAKEWVKSIEEYIAANQAYPSALTIYCIGESNITDLDADPDVDCGLSNNVKKNSSTYTAAFNNGIKTLRSSLPIFPGKQVQVTPTVTGAGVLFRATDTYDVSGENVANYPTLMYFLEGPNQDCILRPLATGYGGGDFTKASASAINTLSSVGTACRIMLPDPRKL